MLSRIAPKGGAAFFVPLNRTTNPRQIFMHPSRSIPQRAEFNADHPFLYVIRDGKTGIVHFVGRFVQGGDKPAAK
jgi:hypothetical protein